MTKKTIKFLKIMQDIMSSGDYVFGDFAGWVLKVLKVGKSINF